MTALSNTKELALKSDAFKDGDFAGKVFIVVSFGHYSVDHGKIEKFIVDYIKEKGGEVRSSAVKNLDYVIVCTRVNLMYVYGTLFDWASIEEGGSELHKTGCQMYNAARRLQKEGKDVRFISDIDLFLHDNLFSKLPAFDKKRLIAECCKGNKSFDAKDIKSVANFMKKNLATDPDFDDLRKAGLDLTAFFDQLNGTPARRPWWGKRYPSELIRTLKTVKSNRSNGSSSKRKRKPCSCYPKTCLISLITIPISPATTTALTSMTATGTHFFRRRFLRMN